MCVFVLSAGLVGRLCVAVFLFYLLGLCPFYFFSRGARLTEKSGIIHDGHGNYSTDVKCSWLVDAGGAPNATIRLHLEEFATECGWDHLYIFDGDSVHSPLLAVFRLALCWYILCGYTVTLIQYFEIWRSFWKWCYIFLALFEVVCPWSQECESIGEIGVVDIRK